MNQPWDIVDWTLRNKLQWNFNRNSNIFIQENAFESVVCEMAAILSRPQCVYDTWLLWRYLLVEWLWMYCDISSWIIHLCLSVLAWLRFDTGHVAVLTNAFPLQVNAGDEFYFSQLDSSPDKQIATNFAHAIWMRLKRIIYFHYAENTLIKWSPERHKSK